MIDIGGRTPPTHVPTRAAAMEDGPQAIAPVAHRLRFDGSGHEYFKVWIVNLALSILTLGIFSAWAKVRNKRYFYGNTTLDGSAFDYTANPVSILKGRLIVLAYIVAYTVLGNTFPPGQAAMIAITIPLVPWVINRSLAFNSRYSAHRGLRFGFEGSYWGAFGTFIVWPVLGALSVGVLVPAAAHRAKAYIVNNTRYGRCHFAYHAKLSKIYAAYAIALILGFGLLMSVIVGVAMVAGIGVVLGVNENPGGSGSIISAFLSLVLVTLGIIAYLLILIVPAAVVQSVVTNHVWNTNELQRDSFEMRLSVARVVWIQVSNLVLIILSLGLFVPYAKVRMLRYRIESFSMTRTEGAAVYQAGLRDRFSATGSELGDAFDLDLGI